jgi:tetratricopeptide (TPR) repeat protein
VTELYLGLPEHQHLETLRNTQKVEGGKRMTTGSNNARRKANEAMQLFHAGDFDGAVQAFTEAITLDPAYALAYHNQGLAYERLGRSEEAKADYAKHASLNWDSRSNLPSTLAPTYDPTTGEDAPQVEREADGEMADEMRRDLRGWGVGLIIIGIAQYFIPFLEPLLAFVLVPLGILSFLIVHRSLFIVIGIALFIIGLLNIFGGSFGLWTFYGGLQIYWGVQEVRKFGKYA